MAMALTGCAWAPCSSLQFQSHRLLPMNAPRLKVCCKAKAKAKAGKKRGWKADDKTSTVEILGRGSFSRHKANERSQMSPKTKGTASKRNFDSDDEGGYKHSRKSRTSSKTKRTASQWDLDSDDENQYDHSRKSNKSKGNATNFNDRHSRKSRISEKPKGKDKEPRTRMSVDSTKKKKSSKLNFDSVLTDFMRESDDEYELEDMDEAEAAAWLENKPSGFGVDKKYDTSVDDELFAQIEKDELARKRGEKVPKVQAQQTKAKPPEPDGFLVDIRQLPRKRNITRDLKAAFKGVNGLLHVKPKENKNTKTREPVCKGSATLTFNSSFNAVSFIEKFRNQTVKFGDKVRKPTYFLLGKKKQQAGESVAVQNSEQKLESKKATTKLRLEKDNELKPATKAKSKTNKVSSFQEKDLTEDSGDDVSEDEQVVESVTDAIVIESLGEEDLSDSEVDLEEWYDDESDEEFEEDDELSDEFDVDAAMDGESDYDYSSDGDEALEEEYSSDELTDEEFEVEALEEEYSSDELTDEEFEVEAELDESDWSEGLDEEDEVLDQVEAVLKASDGESDDEQVEVEPSLKDQANSERDEELELASSVLPSTEASLQVSEKEDVVNGVVSENTMALVVSQNTTALAPIFKGMQPVFNRDYELEELRAKEQKLLDKIIRAGKKRAARSPKFASKLTFKEATKTMAKLTLAIHRAKKQKNNFVKRGKKKLKIHEAAKKLTELRRLRDAVIGLRRNVRSKAKIAAKLANRRKREEKRALWMNDKEKREARLGHYLSELKLREAYDQQKAIGDEQQDERDEALRLTE